MSATKAFNTLAEGAGILNLPRSFLEGEVQANRLPHLKVGRRILIDVDAVREWLIQQSRSSVQGETCGAR